MAYGQKLSWVMKKNLGERVVMHLMLVILVEQSELCEIIWRFGLKGVAVADSDWDEDDWESVQIERRFNLGKEDGGDDLIKGDCDKDDDDDDDYDDCGNNASCSVSTIKSENLMFPFSIRWGDLDNTVPCLESYLAQSSLGLGAWKSFVLFLQ